MFRGLGELYLSCYNLFLQLIYTEVEINDLKAVLSMLSCGTRQRSNNTYIEWIMCFSESERDPRYVGFIGKKYHELKAEFVCLNVVCVCVCVRACV